MNCPSLNDIYEYIVRGNFNDITSHLLFDCLVDIDEDDIDKIIKKIKDYNILKQDEDPTIKKNRVSFCEEMKDIIKKLKHYKFLLEKCRKMDNRIKKINKDENYTYFYLEDKITQDLDFFKINILYIITQYREIVTKLSTWSLEKEDLIKTSQKFTPEMHEMFEKSQAHLLLVYPDIYKNTECTENYTNLMALTKSKIKPSAPPNFGFKKNKSKNKSKKNKSKNKSKKNKSKKK